MRSVAIVIGSYLPGRKSGGPVRSIANIVERLGDEYEFSIVTADRDFGESRPYENVEAGRWTTLGKSRVRYLRPWEISPPALGRVLREVDYDLLYVNNLFATISRATFVLRRLNRLRDRPTVIAPRGELSAGALALKAWKKAPYLWLTDRLGLYKSVVWHASSEVEKDDILRVFCGGVQRGRDSLLAKTRVAPEMVCLPLVQVAPNLSGGGPAGISPSRRPGKEPGSARIAFLSRISRKKNLDGALRLLATAQGSVDLDVYGYREDESYWHECEKLIGQLPANVRVAYRGVADPDDVIGILSGYHLLFVPTLGENFGHVFVEGLSAGCLILTSDRTPWRGLAERKVGWDLPLSDADAFRRAIGEVVAMDSAEFDRRSALAVDYARRFAEDPSVVEANRQLFSLSAPPA